jgi:hypothetical protein
MLFMVIERFKDGDAPSVYRRFRDRGRLMPEVSGKDTAAAFAPLLEENGASTRS